MRVGTGMAIRIAWAEYGQVRLNKRGRHRAAVAGQAKSNACILFSLSPERAAGAWCESSDARAGHTGPEASNWTGGAEAVRSHRCYGNLTASTDRGFHAYNGTGSRDVPGAWTDSCNLPGPTAVTFW